MMTEKNIGDEDDVDTSTAVKSSKNIFSKDFDDDQASGSDDQEPILVSNVQDRYHIVQITMWIMGTCTLLPWNFFITASTYWLYKFRTVGEKVDSLHKNQLQASFESYLTVSATVSLTIFLFISTLYGYRFRLKLRTLFSLGFITILMIITTVFIKINTDEWQKGFLAFTLVIVVLINAATAIFQSAVGGLASMLPSNCMNAMMNGQALGGVFASVANVLTLLDPNVDARNSALAYFLVAIFVLLVTIICYVGIQKSEFLKHHTHRHASDHHTHSITVVFAVFRKIWPYCLTAWFILTSTLAVFPAILVNSYSKNFDNNTMWTGTLFVPLVIFVLFNISDFSGRTVSLWLSWPENRSPVMYILTIARVVIPCLLLFCNREPRHGLPVLFHEDYDIVILMVFFGLTNGYLLTLAMMYAPRNVSTNEQEITGILTTTFAGTGVMSGTLIGMALVHTL